MSSINELRCHVDKVWEFADEQVDVDTDVEALEMMQLLKKICYDWMDIYEEYDQTNKRILRELEKLNEQIRKGV